MWSDLQSKFGDFYKKGINLSFLLSQLGDNAAIIVGGSSMLLNNAKKFMKEGMSEEADQKSPGFVRKSIRLVVQLAGVLAIGSIIVVSIVFLGFKDP